MKKKNVCAVACLFWLAGCSSSSSDEIEIVQRLFPVQFSVQLQKEILPFSPTRSMPSNTVPEPTVRTDDTGPEKELADFCSTIEYLVYDKSDSAELVKHCLYNVDAEHDFSIVYDTLPAGNYQVYFLAHQAGESSFSGNVFSCDTLSDAFYGTEAFEVEAGGDISRDINLVRIVSRVEFKAIDPVPEDIKTFEISVENYPSRLNILTREGIVSSEAYTLTKEFATEEKGETGNIHSFYSFVPSGDKTMSATLTSTDTEGQVLRNRTVAGITPIANKIIRYTGILYTPPKPDESENTFNLTVWNNGEWDEAEENELPE